MHRTITMMLAVVALAAAGLRAETANDRSVELPIKRVTVYPGSAQIRRSADIEVQPGRQALLVKGLPGDINTSWLRASVLGDGVVLLGLSHSEERHLEAAAEEVARLERELNRLENDEQRVIVDHIATLNKLRDFLDRLGQAAATQSANQVDQGRIDVAQWSGAYGFLADHHGAVDDSLRLLELKLDSVVKKIDLVRTELDQKKTARQTVTKTARIEVEASRPTTIQLNLDYVARNVRWVPLYDARLSEADESVRLYYFAEITQRSGEDWNDVELTLSTALPLLGAGPGTLMPWYLPHLPNTVDNLLANVVAVTASSAREIPIRGGMAGEVAYVLDEQPIGDPLGGRGDADEDLGQFSTSRLSMGSFPATFTVQQKETVPSGGEAVRTVIAEWTLTGETRLIARPRNREGAFRVISLENQDTAPLLRGRVSIFVGQHFLGNADIARMVPPGDDFDLPFGQDRLVDVKRVVLWDKRSSHGENLRTGQTVKITLNNHGTEAREIRVEESLPLSRDDRVKVRLDDFTPKADSIDARGLAYWTLSLIPDQERVITVKYRVEHPADMVIDGL